ncbi:MAG TPA: hypothetical protein VEN78_22730 [Bradyrhizobium sp.]|nr:hypothetical protein [Bradyrhizobium sp.]
MSLSNEERSPHFFGAACDPSPRFWPSCSSSAASADSRVFIIANQADGYGVDQCLAMGEKCGAHAARSYCQSRDFAQALSYRHVDPDEITGSIPTTAAANCTHAGCNDYVAITCQR